MDAAVRTTPAITLPDVGLELWPSFYAPAPAWAMLDELWQTVQWSADHFFAFERRIALPRLQAWYADPGVRYRYSDNLLPQREWLPLLLHLKRELEQQVQHDFNSVLLTYYRNGADSVSWHADDEQELGAQPWIASLSLGASRVMQYRHQQLPQYGELVLHHGDLLLMQPQFQQHWQHRVPEQEGLTQARLNLTFRLVTG